MKKREGSIGDIMVSGLSILAMTVVMMAYMNSVELIQQKMEAGQLARKYVLRMETVGYLTSEDKTILTRELTDLGITDIDYTGSTDREVPFGSPITLKIQGKLKGEYVFEEHRVSTAKN